MQTSMRPTTLGDLRITSLQVGGLYKRPYVASPPFTLNTGGSDHAPSGYGFLAVGSASSYQIVYVGSAVSAPRIAMPSGA